MATFKLESSQIVPISLEEAWSFFSSPMNLSVITPKYMKFKVLGKVETEIYNNMLINYTVRPLFNVPLKWQTKILDVVPSKSFIDIQTQGPFKRWEHQHRFTEVENGTRIDDKVVYELPFGLIGRMAHRLLLKQRVEDIFKYRKKVLSNLFEKGVPYVI